jgi:hypothetical protein
LALFVSLRAVEDRASGGAQITTSQTHATIYLVPSPLGDEPAATVRLFPHVSLEEDM